MTVAVALRGVRATFDDGASFAIDDLDLEVLRGEFLVLAGESGCGKTTTLRLINRLMEAAAGEIEVDGRPVADSDPVALRRRIGYVIQGVGLFPHLTVAENVAVVPRLLGWDRTEIDTRVDELLDLVHLPAGEYRDRRPAHLSGGQAQRVGVARALAARPAIMLMDEPFGALDPLTRDALQEEYRAIHDRLDLTTVMVTHDLTEALLLADRIAVMRDGGIVRVGTPRELLAEKEEYVRRLMAMPRRNADRIEALLAEDGA